MNRSSAYLLASAFALLGAMPSNAADSRQTVSVAVNFSDLNVSKEEGASMLIGRIEAAARVACGPEPDNRNLTGHPLFVKCYNEAENNAIDHLGNPVVSRLANRAEMIKTAGN